jgi:hypothetical protein
MPTPDDVMRSPVEHESTTAHTTCPPDEVRTVAAHESSQSPIFNATSHVEPVIDVPMQLPTPPPQDSPAHAPPSPENHSKPSGACIEEPSRDIPTPMTATDDGPDEQRTSQTSPLSATAPGPTSLLASHLSSPFPPYRVCKI